jgi:hypothetical protein
MTQEDKIKFLEMEIELLKTKLKLEKLKDKEIIYIPYQIPNYPDIINLPYITPYWEGPSYTCPISSSNSTTIKKD